MTPFTPAQMVAAVRRRTNTERSLFVKDDEILQFINECSIDLHNLLVTTLGPDHWAKEKTLFVPAGVGCCDAWVDITSGTLGYSGTVYDYADRLLRLEYEIDGRGYPLEPFSLGSAVVDRNPVEWRGNLPRYDFRFTAFYFDRVNVKDENLRMYYIPRPPTFTPDSPNVLIPDWMARHQDYYILYASMQVKDKQEEDCSVLIRQLDRMTQSIASSAGPKDMGKAQSITMSRAAREGNFYGGNDYFSPNYDPRSRF